MHMVHFQSRLLSCSKARAATRIVKWQQARLYVSLAIQLPHVWWVPYSITWAYEVITFHEHFQPRLMRVIVILS